MKENKKFSNTVNVHNHFNFSVNSMGGIQLVILLLGIFFIQKKWLTNGVHNIKKSEKT
ncbi:hypothetical protein [Bacillus sp. CGMCC 1.16541]|uniref:hypothetical protein n=1 Tax=Bacillus sp. CGMCC 1.16541 TaxID=2185143 RepID=UPI0013A54DB2|nr:hypothetical protein [Bacillus sp. CGMCC 1.16541]